MAPVPIPNLANRGRQEINTGRDILLVAHFDYLMNIASRDGNGSRDGTSRRHPLEPSRVRPTGLENLGLPLDLLFLRRAL